MNNNPYGHELILDLHDCTKIPCTRAFLEKFFKDLCHLIDMERSERYLSRSVHYDKHHHRAADLHFWDYEGYPQDYAEAPDHTIDVPRAVLLNIFSCKPFDPVKTKAFCAERFGGRIAASNAIQRMVRA